MIDNNRPVSELIPELGSQVVQLMKSEAGLLRAEVNEKVERLETAAGSLAAGIVCLIAGLIVLLQAIVVALVNAGLGPGWSALLVGVMTIGVGFLLIRYGGGQASRLAPRRTINEAQRTADMVREKVQ